MSPPPTLLDAALSSTLLVAFFGGLWVASRARFRPPPLSEGFADDPAGGSVQSVRGQRFKIDVVDASEPYGMGRCLVLDGRRQFCEVDRHKYDEMIVHFPCAFLAPGRPERALVLHGGDCGTLREVLKYGASSLKRVVVVEEDERVIDVCERHLDAQPMRNAGDRRVVWMTGATAADAVAKLADEQGNLQSFDLIVIDGKDRPSTQISPDTARNLKLLLAPEGVVACGGGPACAGPTLDPLFAHKISYSFFSDTHDAQTRMVAYARFDLSAADVDGEALAQRVSLRFFDASDVWSYVPWFLRHKIRPSPPPTPPS